MSLREVAAIAGKPGLYKVLKPTHNGMIIESLDNQKKKSVINAQHRVSILQEISVFTNSDPDSVPLGEIFDTLKEKMAGGLTLAGKENKDYYDFFEEVLPEFDMERVYPSDIKKILKWYEVLLEFAPDVLEASEEEAPKEEEKES